MSIQDELYIQKEGEYTDAKIYRRVLLWQFRSSSKKHQRKQIGATQMLSDKYSHEAKHPMHMIWCIGCCNFIKDMIK